MIIILLFWTDESRAGSTASTPNSSQTQIPIDQYTLFRQLSVSSQNLAKHISSMGFPIERVARVVDKFGKDDKKVRKLFFSSPNSIKSPLLTIDFYFSDNRTFNSIG